MFPKFLKRLAVVGALSGLLATAGVSAAHAAAPTYPTNSTAPVYLIDAINYQNLPAGPLPWIVNQGVVLSGVSEPVAATTLNGIALPYVAGSSSFVAFITTPGTEFTKSAWTATGVTTTALSGAGAMAPNVSPNFITVGANAANVKNNGGTYSLGVAYLDSIGNTVTAAFFTAISVTAGTGAWEFATPAAAVVVTNVATTTALAASTPAVTTGGSAILTATVSAPGKTVSGNVQFLEGSTVLGTVALAGGTASKSVAVSPAGAHNYTATFVENTVGTDKFLASSSTAVTVTATDAPPPVVPKAPSESALNTATANGASAVYTATDHKVALTVNASNNGKTVNAFVYSTPIFLGAVSVTGGTISFDISVLPAGLHKILITDPTTNDVLAWASFTKTDAAIAPAFSKTINADVANGAANPADGEFSLTNLSSSTVNLVNPALVNGKSIVSGQLGNFKVTDMRVVTKAGWTLKTDVAQFAKGTDTIANSALGIAPVVVTQTAGTAPVMGAAQVSGSASYPWNFATLAAGSYSGVSTYNADLVFTAPTGSPAGTYTSTLTLTLISN